MAGLKPGCIVPRQKLGSLKIGFASMNRRQAVQAQMRPLMVVIPHELRHVTDAQLGAAGFVNEQAFFIQSAKETLYLAVGLRVMRPGQPPRHIGIASVVASDRRGAYGRSNRCRSSPLRSDGATLSPLLLETWPHRDSIDWPDAGNGFPTEIIHHRVSVFP
jgi:hypothetical protein